MMRRESMGEIRGDRDGIVGNRGKWRGREGKRGEERKIEGKRDRAVRR